MHKLTNKLSFELVGHPKRAITRTRLTYNAALHLEVVQTESIIVCWGHHFVEVLGQKLILCIKASTGVLLEIEDISKSTKKISSFLLKVFWMSLIIRTSLEQGSLLACILNPLINPSDLEIRNLPIHIDSFGVVSLNTSQTSRILPVNATATRRLWLNLKVPL
jgi:hypothetical protein